MALHSWGSLPTMGQLTQIPEFPHLSRTSDLDLSLALCSPFQHSCNIPALAPVYAEILLWSGLAVSTSHSCCSHNEVSTFHPNQPSPDLCGFTYCSSLSLSFHYLWMAINTLNASFLRLSGKSFPIQIAMLLYSADAASQIILHWIFNHIFSIGNLISHQVHPSWMCDQNTVTSRNESMWLTVSENWQCCEHEWSK
jgi:hypothetical protein